MFVKQLDTQFIEEYVIFVITKYCLNVTASLHI